IAKAVRPRAAANRFAVHSATFARSDRGRYEGIHHATDLLLVNPVNLDGRNCGRTLLLGGTMLRRSGNTDFPAKKKMRLARFIPAPAKEMIKNGLRFNAIRRALKPLKATGTMTDEEIATLHQAWGNDGFAADRDFLAQLLTLLKGGPVLECGTGATTLI